MMKMFARAKDTQQFVTHFVFGDRFALLWHEA